MGLGGLQRNDLLETHNRLYPLHAIYFTNLFLVIGGRCDLHKDIPCGEYSCFYCFVSHFFYYYVQEVKE